MTTTAVPAATTKTLLKLEQPQQPQHSCSSIINDKATSGKQRCGQHPPRTHGKTRKTAVLCQTQLSEPRNTSSPEAAAPVRSKVCRSLSCSVLGLRFRRFRHPIYWMIVRWDGLHLSCLGDLQSRDDWPRHFVSDIGVLL